MGLITHSSILAFSLVAPPCNSDRAMILEPRGEHTLDQLMSGQVVGMPFEAIFRSMSDDIFSYARRGLDMPDVAQQDTHTVDELHI